MIILCILWLKGKAAEILCYINFEDGKKEFRNLLEKEPTNAGLYSIFAKTLGKLGNLDEALSYRQLPWRQKEEI